MEQLVEAAQQGDPRAQEELFGNLLVRFRRFALRKVGAGYADEVAQEACVTIHRKYKTENGRSRCPRGWTGPLVLHRRRF
jgi:DNA-directed RNA polymerase specialized sigma24 family protein